MKYSSSHFKEDSQGKRMTSAMVSSCRWCDGRLDAHIRNFGTTVEQKQVSVPAAVTGGRLFLHAAFLRGTLPPDGDVSGIQMGSFQVAGQASGSLVSDGVMCTVAMPECVSLTLPLFRVSSPS